MEAKIAVLWISAAVAMSAHAILMILDPAPMKKAAEWATTASQGEWILMALFWLVPLWMAFAATAVKGASSRWLQFCVAVAFTMLNAWHFFICGVPLLGPGPFARPVIHHVLLVGSTGVATVLIAWYAWKWPKREV